MNKKVGNLAGNIVFFIISSLLLYICSSDALCNVIFPNNLLFIAKIIKPISRFTMITCGLVTFIDIFFYIVWSICRDTVFSSSIPHDFCSRQWNLNINKFVMCFQFSLFFSLRFGLCNIHQQIFSFQFSLAYFHGLKVMRFQELNSLCKQRIQRRVFFQIF